MPATLTDTTRDPIIVVSGTSVTPFTAITITDPLLSAPPYEVPPGGGAGKLVITLAADGGPVGSLGNPGAAVPGSFSGNTFTGGTFGGANVPGTLAPTPTLAGVTYTAPVLAAGQGETVDATVNYLPGAEPEVSDPTPVVLQIVTAPAIAGTLAGQPVASGASLRPFATTQVTDGNFGGAATVTATITVSDGGTATDADGLLSGAGLTKTGTGVYALAASSAFAAGAALRGLSFTPSPVAGGTQRDTGFSITVADSGAALSTTDGTTSVVTMGATPAPTAPLIAGTQAGQSVVSGNLIDPFAGVTITDGNASPLDSATITLSGGGTLSGAGLSGGGGSYTLAAQTPAALTSALQGLTFSGGTGTTSLTLSVTDAGLTTTDAATSVATAAPAPAVSAASAAFSVTDETNGQQTAIQGATYSGPVANLAQQIILIGPDNLNISATVPNVFIHTGSGTDAINVSAAGGSNVLDGSTGSNFLTGGSGNDTFFLDDRGTAADVYSTIVNFHAGDNATVFGVNASDFTLTTLDGQGADGYKGLDLQFTAPNHPTASLVLTGLTAAALTNGALTLSYGTTADLPGAPGSTYLNIHAN